MFGNCHSVVVAQLDLLAREEPQQTLSGRADGLTMQAIADDLNAEKVPTAHGGARWYPKVVSDILRRSAALDGVTV